MYAFQLNLNTNFGDNVQVGHYINQNAPACEHQIGGACLVQAANANCAVNFPGETIGACHAHAFRNCFTQGPTGVLGYPNGINYPGGATAYAAQGYPYVYLNSSCQVVGTSSTLTGNPPGTNLCGGILFTGQSSPISLVFDESYDVDKDVAITTFPLELNAKGTAYLWKASAKAPLLVYDPEHRGQITSAAQLFGDWTFGGKRLVSLVDSNMSTKWRDGYEALASMDSNNDRKVAGEELKNMALWFDVNQNGISEEGEVQSLASHGITELYYQADRRDEITKNIFASRGFMRVIDGKTSFGGSVDWYAARADSYQALMNLIDTKATQNKPEESVKEDTTSPYAKNPGTLTGRWMWKATSAPDFPANQAPQGIFYIIEGDDGSISVVSMNLSSAKAEKSGTPLIASLMTSMAGTVSGGTKGSTVIKFETIDNDNRATIRSTAVLQDDGSLDGESVAAGTFKLGKSGSIKYQWTAEKQSE